MTDQDWAVRDLVDGEEIPEPAACADVTVSAADVEAPTVGEAGDDEAE
jgi:hypothetical protein